MNAAMVHALEAACFAPHGWSLPQVTGTLDHSGAVCVAEPNVGYALGVVILDEVELYRIGVVPSARQRGHGQRILADFIAAARARGASRLFLEVREDNRPARALYGAAGLTELGRRPRYYPDGCTALLLGCPLPSPRAEARQLPP